MACFFLTHSVYYFTILIFSCWFFSLMPGPYARCHNKINKLSGCDAGPAGSKRPSKMYNRLELKRDARKTFKTVRKLVGNRQCRKDLKMVSVFVELNIT